MHSYVNKENILQFVICFAVVSLILIWLSVHPQKHMNHDIAYLTNSAVHMLAGESMSEAYYEINPPLSVIVQIPSALMIKYIGISIYYAVFIQALVLTMLSSLFMFFILKKIPWINKEEKLLLLSTYILANTLMTGYEFGQKDQYIILFLFPMSLLLALTTYRIKIKPLLKWSVMISGSIFILLKPHYGIIPASIFIHRAIVQRRFSVVFDKDFLCLGTLFFLYIALIFIFFDDYITQILPDVLEFYVSDILIYTFAKTINYAFIVFIFIIGSTFLFKKPQGFIIFLFCMALLSLIPFVIQGKGVDYHTIPARIFFICGLSVFIMRIISIAFQRLLPKNHIYLSIFGTFLIILLIIYPFFTKPLVRMSHNEYKETQLVKILQECPDNDAVFIYDGRSYTAQLLPVYANKTHASRFSDFWVIPFFLKIEQDIKQGKKNSLSNDELNIKIKKYGDMVAQDLNKYKPGIILISPIKYFQMIEEPFYFETYFSKYSDEFKDIWKSYNFVEELDIDRTPYFAKKNIYNIGTYRVYKRNECKTKSKEMP